MLQILANQQLPANPVTLILIINLYALSSEGGQGTLCVLHKLNSCLLYHGQIATHHTSNMWNLLCTQPSRWPPAISEKLVWPAQMGGHFFFDLLSF